jgi:myosin-crossreactive antigen
MPATYRLLLELGIKEDHTMGYSTHLGFRAGIAAPFYWFDLETNEQTELRLMPFCAMDITPLHYRGESPSEATETIHELMLKVHEVGGLFVSLWHNESFSETERWIGWSSVYEDILAKAHELKP